MIVQCRKCATKYRFDESVVEGDGMWVRCSRCRHVFFQTKPEREKAVEQEVAPPVEETTISAAGQNQQPPQPETAAEEPSPEPSPEPEMKAGLDKVVDHISDMEKFIKEELETSPLEPEIVFDDLDREKEDMLDGRMPDLGREEQKKKKGGGLGRFFVLAVIIVILVLGLAVAYFRYFPGADKELLKPLSSRLPILAKVLGIEEARKVQETHTVKFVDVKPRSLINAHLGKIRVVEGVLTNTSAYPLTKIMVKGELMDGGGKILDSQTVFCGITLTEDELKTLSEEEIQAKLNQPPQPAGGRLAPGETLPFMLVFMREIAGVEKTVVRLGSAERFTE